LSVLWFGLCSLFLIGDEKSLFFLIILIPFAWGVLYVLFWVGDGFKSKSDKPDNDIFNSKPQDQNKENNELLTLEKLKEGETFFEGMVSSFYAFLLIFFIMSLLLMVFEVAIYLGFRIFTGTSNWFLTDIMIGPWIEILSDTVRNQIPLSWLWIQNIINNLEHKNFSFSALICALAILLIMIIGPLDDKLQVNRKRRIEKSQQNEA